MLDMRFFLICFDVERTEIAIASFPNCCFQGKVHITSYFGAYLFGRTDIEVIPKAINLTTTFTPQVRREEGLQGPNLPTSLERGV